MKTIFIGPNGIRAGWRFLIFLILSVIFRLAVFSLPVFRRLIQSTTGGTLTPVSDSVLSGISAILSFLAAFIMSRIEKRNFASYGIPLKGAFGKLFWQGVIWGLAIESVEILLIYACGGFSFGGLALAGPALLKYATAWAMAFLIVGINEEFTFRGYAQYTIASGISFWPAAALLSALFGGVHLFNPNEGLVGGLSVFLFGLFACFTLKRTGNLWFAIGFHAASDYAETFIYSVPDSGYNAVGQLLHSNLQAGPRWLTGGAIGPEGSVFVFVLLALAFPIFAWLYPARPKPTSQESAASSLGQAG